MLNLMVVVFHILSKTDFNLRKYASKAPYIAINSIYIFRRFAWNRRSFDATVNRTRIMPMKIKGAVIISIYEKRKLLLLITKCLRARDCTVLGWQFSNVFNFDQFS